MKIRYLLTIAFLAVAMIGTGQQPGTWDNWYWLIGTWQGEGSGIPGEGSGTFTFAFDLEKNVIIRRSHSEYPGENIKTRIIHDDLMIVHLNNSGNPSKAVYFDNEGHTINYNITFPDKSIVLTSEIIPETPVFRLVYTSIDNETVNTRFEMSRDGVNFMTYVEGKSRKEKPNSDEK
jgi:hypothetical protein